MDRKKAEQKTLDYFESGFHCAESILKSAIDIFTDNPKDFPLLAASGFGGGMGRTRKEACGALTGGIIAIGYLFGREQPGENIKTVMALSAKFRKRFEESNSTTICEELIQKLGKQKKYMKCKQMTAESAGILYEIIVDHYPKRK